MVAFGFAILCLLLALLALVLDKVYFYLPAKELKFRADKGDSISRELAKAAAYGGELELVLRLEAIVFLAIGYVLFGLILPGWAAILIVAIVLAIALLWLPNSRLSRFEVQISVWLTPIVVWKLQLLHPVIQSPAAKLQRRRKPHFTGLYERSDLQELLNRQAAQRDNRISEQELTVVRNALQFSGLKVEDAMIFRENVTSVSADDEVGPVFLAELHESGHDLFPVYEGKKSSVVGLLSIDTVANVKPHGKVRDCYDPHLAYLHEKDSLSRALRAFYETHQHLFIVINDRGEYSGIITLSDILRKLFGAIEQESFGRYDDKQAVAKRKR